ncbi:hypothetical protein [Clostridium sp.]|uniref:hypothetical protein n=1 Tax=Clostridium sp. TaxID=1506 RepID=UPI001A552A3E|nr:hypothetical protein [Clostridium sp.]MBK5236275.1 hypothetical protein [Clostridium sp.]
MTYEQLSDDQSGDIIPFYKRIFKSIEPTIIELVGTTGAGKTTFCQQFVDEEGKRILNKIITTSGNRTMIPIDIVILENTKSRIILKARTKSDITRDLILVAINIDSEFKFDINKSITDVVNKTGLKKNNEYGIKVNIDLYQSVYNLFGTIKLIEEFLEIAKDLQSNFTNEDNVENYISNNISNKKLIKLLDDIIFTELNIDDFYGHRHEILLDQENIIEKTIIPTNAFNKYKQQKEGLNQIASCRILFEHATLLFRCDEKAKRCLPEKFRKGVVFREPLGNKEARLISSVTNSCAINKILLIPVATGGLLVDDKGIEELKNIILSESKQNIVVVTKIDKSSSYEEYTLNNYKGYIESIKEQIVITHNNLIDRLELTEECNANQVNTVDRNIILKKIIAFLDNAYLSKITKDKQGFYDAELHKIICKNKSNQEISVSDIEDVIILDNFHTLVSSILERKNKLSYNLVT